MTQPVFETTAAALREKSKLRRHFRRFDMLFYLICTVVTIDTIGAVASNGAQGFTWLIFLGVFFFLPYALSVAELGSAFPQEGGPYVWSRLAFGRPLAAINSVIYWISNPIWIGGSLTIVSFAAIEEFFGPVGGPSKYVYALGFIWFTIGTAIVSLRYGKWVPTLGAWARGAVLTFFVVSVGVYAARHGVHGFGGHAFLPSYAVFIAVVPAFQITGADSSRYFAAVLGLTISTTTISYLFIFPALVKLRYSRPDVERPYRVPGGMAGAWICSVVPTFWALLATVALIWPGFGVNWFGAGGNPNDDLAALSFSHQRLQYELAQIVPLAVIVLIGVLFYFLGGKTRRETTAEPVAPAYVPAESPERAS
jgi:amino acid transporter